MRAKKVNLNFTFYLFLAAFSVRLLYLCELAPSPFFRPARGLDPHLYHTWALSILEKDWLGKEVFKAMPLYPYLLALLFALTGKDLFFVYLLQLLLGSLNCLLLFRLGEHLEGRPLGGLAAFFLAFSGISIFYEAMLVPTALISFLLLSTLLVLSSAKTLSRWMSGGLLWGLAALTHAGVLLWSPFVFLRGLWSQSPKKRLTLAGCFLALGLVLAASMLRNFLVAGEPVLLTAHGGINFFIGNNPKASGQFRSHFSRYTSAEQLFWQSKQEAQRIVGHSLTDGESSRFWFREGWGFIRKDPLTFSKLLWRKWFFFWNAYEIPDVEDFYFFRNQFPVLKRAPFQSAFLCPLALFGILLSLRRPRRFFLVYGILFATIAGLLFFFVNSRYRAPLLPFLALFAAYGLLRIVDFLRRRRRGALLASLFLLLHLTLWTRGESFTEERAIGHYNVAIAYTHAGRFEEAIEELKVALLTTRDEGMVYFAIGNAYFGQGHYEKAEESFQTALHTNPRFTDAYFNLGVTLIQLNRKEEARKALRQALRLDPEGTDIRSRLEELDGKSP